MLPYLRRIGYFEMIICGKLFIVHLKCIFCTYIKVLRNISGDVILKFCYPCKRNMKTTNKEINLIE